MSAFAFTRNRGSVYADLPPTLQPCAIAAAAPQGERLQALGISGMIYLLILGAGAVATSFPAAAPKGLLKTHQPERVFVFEPAVPRPPQNTWSAAEGGLAAGTGNLLPVRVIAPSQDPDLAAAALPGLERSGALPTPLGLPGNGQPGPGLASGAGSVGSGGAPTIHDFSMTGLEVLSRVEPNYPDLARRSRIQGTVLLLMTVNEVGVPTQVQPLEGHLALRDAAIRAARQWRFVPARVAGQPVPASFRLTLKFSLR